MVARRTFTEEFKERIRHRYWTTGDSQKQIADDEGLHPPQVSKIIKGTKKEDYIK